MISMLQCFILGEDKWSAKGAGGGVVTDYGTAEGLAGLFAPLPPLP